MRPEPDRSRLHPTELRLGELGVNGDNHVRAGLVPVVPTAGAPGVALLFGTGQRQRSQVIPRSGTGSPSEVTGHPPGWQEFYIRCHRSINTYMHEYFPKTNASGQKLGKKCSRKKNSPTHNRHQKIIRQISTEAGIKPMRLLTPVYNCNRLCWLPSLPIHLWKSPIALSDSIWAKHLWPAALNHHYNLPPQSPPGTDGAGDNALRGSRFNKPSS